MEVDHPNSHDGPTHKLSTNPRATESSFRFVHLFVDGKLKSTSVLSPMHYAMLSQMNGKLRITVRHDARRYSVQSHDLFHIDLGIPLHIVGSPNGNKVSRFCQSINYYPNRVELLPSQW